MNNSRDLRRFNAVKVRRKGYSPKKLFKGERGASLEWRIRVQRDSGRIFNYEKAQTLNQSLMVLIEH